jgi:hypothetical protein
MQSSQSFGRRAASPIAVAATLPAVRKIRIAPKVPPPPEPAPALAQKTAATSGKGPETAPLTVEQELEQWKESRKIKKRSFKEPWRSVSIVAGIAFVATSWMIPDEVSDVAQVALGVLTLGSFIAGWRAKKTPQT